MIAGQISTPGVAADGPVGAALSVEAGRAQAEIATLKLLAVLDDAVEGDASRIIQVLRLGVFIAATANFDKHSAVADGASDLLEAVLGERGRHARAAVGVVSLPALAAVEVDAMVWVRA